MATQLPAQYIADIQQWFRDNPDKINGRDIRAAAAQYGIPLEHVNQAVGTTFNVEGAPQNPLKDMESQFAPFTPQIPTQGEWQGYGHNPPPDNIAGILPDANALYQQGGPQPYDATQLSWFTPMQEQGWQTQLQGGNSAVTAANQNNALAQAAGSAFTNNLDRLTQMGDPNYINNIGPSMDFFNNPYLDQAVQSANEATARDFNRTINPGITANAVGAGTLGSSRTDLTRRLALEDLGETMSNQTAQMYNQGYNNGLQGYLSDRSTTLGAVQGLSGQGVASWNTAPSILGMGFEQNLMPSQGIMGLGETQAGIGANYQDLNTRYLQEGANLWNQQQTAPYNNLNWYANVVNSTPSLLNTTSNSVSNSSSNSVGNTTTNTASNSQGINTNSVDPNTLGQLAGAGMLAYGGYNSGMFDDFFDSNAGSGYTMPYNSYINMVDAF